MYTRVVSAVENSSTTAFPDRPANVKEHATTALQLGVMSREVLLKQSL